MKRFRLTNFDVVGAKSGKKLKKWESALNNTINIIMTWLAVLSMVGFIVLTFVLAFVAFDAILDFVGNKYPSLFIPTLALFFVVIFLKEKKKNK